MSTEKPLLIISLEDPQWQFEDVGSGIPNGLRWTGHGLSIPKFSKGDKVWIGKGNHYHVFEVLDVFGEAATGYHEQVTMAIELAQAINF